MHSAVSFSGELTSVETSSASSNSDGSGCSIALSVIDRAAKAMLKPPVAHIPVIDRGPGLRVPANFLIMVRVFNQSLGVLSKVEGLTADSFASLPKPI